MYMGRQASLYPNTEYKLRDSLPEGIVSSSDFVNGNLHGLAPLSPSSYASGSCRRSPASYICQNTTRTTSDIVKVTNKITYLDTSISRLQPNLKQLLR